MYECVLRYAPCTGSPWYFHAAEKGYLFTENKTNLQRKISSTEMQFLIVKLHTVKAVGTCMYLHLKCMYKIMQIIMKRKIIYFSFGI